MNEARLLAECARLKAIMQHGEAGFCFWPSTPSHPVPDGANQCGRCTNGARLIAEKFGGFVAGYPIGPEDPQDLIGAFAGGHDFAVIGLFIVDWWAWEYEQAIPSPVMLRVEGVARGLYKPESFSQVCPENDFRH